MFKEAMLKLACVSASDRRQILSRLTPTERKLVESVLKEIEQLGLNRDPSVVSTFFQGGRVKEEAKILPSELNGIENIESLEPFWQRFLFGCLETAERLPVKRKYGLTVKIDDALDGIPSGLKRSFINTLKMRKSEHLS